jgi:hypothetical protein
MGIWAIEVIKLFIYAFGPALLTGLAYFIIRIKQSSII